MNKFSRALLRTIAGVVAAVLLVPLGYAAFVAYAWLTDPSRALADPKAGSSDFSRLAHAEGVRVVVPDPDPQMAVAQLSKLVREAATQHKKITIAGSRHSMGGHTLLDRSLCIDMRCAAFRQIGPVVVRDGIGTVRVGAGATWHELLAGLDRSGWSVAVMQSNDDFTVGGSISVNCHGWQPHAPPIDSTIEAFRILLADGSVRECRRDRAEDSELFRAVCGGYGLLGVILDADLRVVPNQLYRAEEFAATADNYTARYEMLAAKSAQPIGLAYGRLSVAPGPWFLRDARIIRFTDVNAGAATRVPNTIAENESRFRVPPSEIAIARYAFRASAQSDFAKWMRWAIERVHGQTHHIVSRNAVLQTPSDWFANRDPRYTEILHEYFVPPAALAQFTDRIRPLLRSTGEIDLLNITVRNVQADTRSLLCYAPQERFGLVMLFRYRANAGADGKMRALTQKLIDAALDCGGSYYLPYRPHATRGQFRRAYPGFAEFRATKENLDPQNVFENSFSIAYLRPE